MAFTHRAHMTQRLAIGIDLGGTHCRAGAVDAEGAIVAQRLCEVGRNRSVDAIVQLVVSLVDELQAELATGDRRPATAVGIGVPGIVEWSEGLVHKAPHFPEWDRVPLAALLRDRLGVPVAIDNDANVVALGELWQGAARELTHCCVLTFGTGIGGALVIDRQVFRGDAGFAGEVGHFTIQFDGPPCACGSAGCWELYASATGMRQLIASSNDPAKAAFLQLFDGNLDRVQPAQILALARDGNIFASTLWKKFGAYCGAGIASLVNITGLHHVVIGGGLSGAWEYFIGETERAIARRTYRATADRIRLHRATLGQSAGIIGAARLMRCLSA